ncbi:MAG TPA: S46 family peptidase, partial [Candidatus Polarisedimenticolia bacterium]|nr:S46 family peptidase [Candidatus Polarisedimenticolia bacterium]
LAALVLCPLFSSPADEGMWLFNQPPREILKERHQFDPSDAWLEHLQKSSVNIGASGSFVSEDGLLISNHHVGSSSLQKLSTKEKNYLRDGFYARTEAEELKCDDLEINVLQSIEDVSARVNEAVPKGADAETAFAARRKVIADIEKESLDKTGLKSEVVTLWQGGTYHLYRYKRYTDVRIVFAPEQQAAFFGGDPDNFEFPRFDFDICLFRAYENGKPAKTTNYLKFSPTGPRDGELVFVSGHPGRTSRLLTMAELENVRDQGLPYSLASLKRREVLLGNWSERSDENARRARQYFFGVQNSRKALNGFLAGLLNPDLMNAKATAEKDFKAQLAGKPEFADALAAYGKIAEATKALSKDQARYALLEQGAGFDSAAFRIARTLLRAGDERPKPNGERLEEYSDANKASMELGLFSPAPIYTDLEILTLSDSLTFFATQLGGDNPLVQKVLAGKSPHARAVELIQNTKVRDVAFRKKLYEGGANAVSAANDPMIELAKLIDPEARALRKTYEDQNEVKHQAHAAIACAANAVLGTGGSRYPDATGTLRLAFGTVKGYTEDDGQAVPAFTTIAGLYDRSKTMNNRPPFDLPASWEAGRKHLNLKTPFNFVSTCDIIGGNSGSPVVNRAGEFVGIIFDGNLQSLAWEYAFDDKQGRATSVDSAAIIEGLDKVYHAKELVRELLDGKRSEK